MIAFLSTVFSAPNPTIRNSEWKRIKR